MVYNRPLDWPVQQLTRILTVHNSVSLPRSSKMVRFKVCAGEAGEGIFWYSIRLDKVCSGSQKPCLCFRRIDEQFTTTIAWDCALKNPTDLTHFH